MPIAARRPIAPCRVLLAALLLLCCTPPARAQANGPVLAAESIPFDGGVVLLDKELLEHREWVVEAIETEIEEAKRARVIDHVAIHRVAIQITDAGFDLLGYDKQGETYQAALERCVERLVDSESPAYLLPDRVTVFMLTKETSKDYLRGGGTLPFTTYNPATDRANVRIGVTFSERDTLLPNMFLLKGHGTKGEDEPFTRDWLTQTLRAAYLYPKDEGFGFALDPLDNLPPKNPAYPVSETGLVDAAMNFGGPLFHERMQLRDDPHTTWFLLGLEFKLGELILQRLDAQRAARVLRAILLGTERDALPDPEPEDQISSIASYLRYISGNTIVFKTSEIDKGLQDYRRAACTKEIALLIEHITIERLPELVRMVEQEQIDSTAKLESVIQKKFGYDITARLDLYQPHDTAQASYDALIKDYFKHRADGEGAVMAMALKLAYEVQLGKTMPDVPGVYQILFDTVSEIPHEQAARAQVVRAWWAALERRDEADALDADNRRKLALAWLTSAIGAKDLTLAYGLLKKLDERPVRFAGQVADGEILDGVVRLARASRHIDAGEFEEARILIDQAMDLVLMDARDDFFQEHIRPLIDRLEMRINTRRPMAPVLG